MRWKKKGGVFFPHHICSWLIAERQRCRKANAKCFKNIGLLLPLGCSARRQFTAGWLWDWQRTNSSENWEWPCHLPISDSHPAQIKPGLDTEVLSAGLGHSSLDVTAATGSCNRAGITSDPRRLASLIFLETTVPAWEGALQTCELPLRGSSFLLDSFKCTFYFLCFL